ncbi:SDR family NAD(P)-dependent oxidoreductase [Marinicrinis lubricantis]|uniref:SDR family NAD(P)-dependent oxidoreductase n=1 Tax=Marinicrinis lubricantis TaxID=2086470 RepID=A0ABW1IJA5_9BACL
MMHFGEQFVGKKVLITGAAGIFGTWIAEAFAEAGASLCLSDIREAELQKLAASPKLKEAQLLLHTTDLSREESVYDLVRLIETTWSSADIVINNAGIYKRQKLMDMTVPDWTQSLGVNVTAPFLLTQQLAKQMIQDGKQGSIINISSGAANNTQIGGGHYSTGKAALSMLTRAFALELAPHNIRVNAVVPGFAPGSEVNALTDEYVQTMISKIPLGRTSGPKDAPQAILFLCSEQASFITGATLSVDGGLAAGTYKKPVETEGKAGI